MKWTRIGMLLLAAGMLLAADPDLKVSETDARKAAIEKPSPEYPMMARQLKLSGKVSLEAIVAADGHVADVRIVTGNPLLTKAGVDALKKWRFKPFQAAGVAVAAVAPVTFEFDTH